VKARYRKRPNQYIVAVQLDLETEGFTYEKWGAKQVCKQGDWLVNNDGDVYTIDQQVFGVTYRKVREGHFVKTTTVLAETAEKGGTVQTKEGSTDYRAGDYIVDNDEDGTDRYAVSKETFEAQYELAEEEE
jgi:hypothetical protein